MQSKILLVDDHPTLRHGLKMIIEDEDDLTVCGETDNINEAITIIDAEKPNIVVVDLSLNDELVGIELIRAISSRFPEVKSLVLSMFDEKMYAERCLRAGARGYVMKKSAHGNIIHAIQRVLQNKLYLSEDIYDDFVERMIDGKNLADEKIIDLLTDKELKVFQLISEGYDPDEIAKKINLTMNTINSHRRRIKEKLNLKNFAELTRTAIKWSISPDM